MRSEPSVPFAPEHSARSGDPDRPNGCTPRRAAGSILAVLLVAACGTDTEAGEGSAERLADEPTTSASAPPPAAPAPAPRPAPAIASGTRMTFEVLEDVSTQSHGAGDSFRLRLTREVTGSDGARIPAGAEARGTVVESRRSSGPEEEAILVLRVSSIQANGGQRAIDATVESASLRSSSGDSGQRTAATIATGAAAGAVIGRILGGDTRSTVVGAAVGAAAGTGIALTNRDGHAVLPRGSEVEARLAAPLVLQ